MSLCEQVEDDLMPIVKKTEDADIGIFGSPVYRGSASDETQSSIGRYIFPFAVGQKILYIDPESFSGQILIDH